ncbi:MAG: sulfatase family protein [Verrucomicrobiia bacterium]|jgi:arylsulfatase A-like enzyme
MKRNRIVTLLALAAIGFSSLVGFAASKRPNILFIMSDDHTAQAVGAYATTLKGLNPTPTIDTLAAEGIVFENAFCVNAICTPSRACIITGKYPHVNGVFDLGGNIKPENQTLPILFRKAGYQTAMVGKWHLKQEPNFDYYKVLPGQGKYHNTEFRIQGDKKWPQNTVTHQGQHSSDAITDSTLEWFKNQRDPNKPFFMCHQYKAPHDYFENAPRYQEYLADVHIPEPPTLYDVPKTFGSIATRGHNDELTRHIGTSIGKRNPRRSYAVDLKKRFPEEFPAYYDPEKMSEVETTRLAYQAYLKKYLRCVKGVDDNLKRLFDYLKKEGLYDNTVIIYTGDQGFWLGEKDYQDKRWAYDPSMRMPFIVRYPESIKAGTRTDAIVENVDYPALMLDFAGIKRPADMQGRSFKAICETGKEPKGWKKAAYYRYWMHMAHHDNPGEMAIRTKTHKLIYFYGADYQGQKQTPPAWELYDLRKDPEEINNVYDQPAYAKVRDRLKEQFARLRKKIGDDGSHYPACEKIVQEFWDYDEADRKKAIQISHDFKAAREDFLKNPPKRKSKSKSKSKPKQK